MRTKSSRIIGMSGVAAFIGTWFTLESTGLFEPLYDFKFQTFNMNHIIFNLFLAIGAGVILGNVLLMRISPLDAIGEYTDFIGDTWDLSQSQAKAVQKQIGSNVRRSIFMMVSGGGSEFLTPWQLLEDVKEKHRNKRKSFRTSVYAANLVAAVSTVDNARLPIIIARPASAAGLKDYEKYRNTTLIILGIIIGIVLVVYLITHFLV